MSKTLVVVESPAKARTIGRFLGKDMRVLASLGHIRDLPEASLGVDVQHDFAPAYVMTANGKRVIRDLEKAAATAKDIFLATDPDREGEAIAWHIQQVLADKARNAVFHRVTFHEITERAVQASFEHPETLNMHKVDAQQARRVVDRLVGYQISPLLWKQIKKGTSAGRVQSVALRLVCEREREILDFKPVEYWNLDALFLPHDAAECFTARLALLDGRKPQVGTAEEANALADELGTAEFAVSQIQKKPRKQSAPPPFITSTLQQAAGAALRFGTSQTMRLAQQLYEGIDLGDGAAGLITYMRTDSVEVAREAQEQALEFIGAHFGARYVPKKRNVYRSRKSAQEAHEAIRPTDVRRTPDSVAAHLSAPQLKLYTLIWNRFVASQMASAEFIDHSIEVEPTRGTLSHKYLFRANSRSNTFPGYLAVYNVKEADQNGDEDGLDAKKLPELDVGTVCSLEELMRKQCFTEPPRRFSEATLVRELEQNGVGRPSTYAATVNTIITREYVLREKGRLVPTELGFSVNDFLVAHFPRLFEVTFTARMETELDEIEEGKVNWTNMLRDFHTALREWLSADAGHAVAAPGNERILEFMNAFPETIVWAPPSKRGKRVYDDGKFFASLRQQVQDGKRLSDRQWEALLTLTARYAAQLPGLAEQAEAVGAAPRLKELAEAHEDAVETANSRPGPSAEDNALLAALDGVTTWAPPVTRGRRVYNDGKFYRSLREQAESGASLSEAQRESLRKLAIRYREQIADFASLAEKFQMAAPNDASDADKALAARLVELLGHITTWEPPRKRGRRVFDDHEFADSIKAQFAARGALSDKQLGALRVLIGRYGKQIPDYAAVAKELALSSPSDKPVTVDATCPECGEKLAVRQTKGGRKFFGCSGYPKCRYATSKLE